MVIFFPSNEGVDMEALGRTQPSPVGPSLGLGVGGGAGMFIPLLTQAQAGPSDSPVSIDPRHVIDRFLTILPRPER